MGSAASTAVTPPPATSPTTATQSSNAVVALAVPVDGSIPAPAHNGLSDIVAPRRLFKKKTKKDDGVVLLPKAYIKDAEVSKSIDLSQPMLAGEGSHVAPVAPLMPRLLMLRMQEATKAIGGGSDGNGRIAEIEGGAVAMEHLKPHMLPLMTSVPLEVYLLNGLQALYLRRNLIATIPEDFTCLKHLRILDLGENRLTEFPVPVTKCIRITDLDLSGNAIPSIPDNIASLVLLSRFQFYGNQIFQLSDALAECKQLTELNVFNNKLVRISPELRSLRRLQDFNISGNKLKTVPAHAEWPQLRRLTASWNTIVLVPPLDGLSGLIYLQLNDNILTEWPESVTTLNRLELLDCSMNEISVLPPEVGRMAALVSLNVRHNKLRELPDTLGRLRKLSVLNVGENRLSALPPSLGKLTGLSVLMADWNRLEHLAQALTQLVSLENATFMGNTALMDDSNPHWRANLAVMTTMRTLAVDHGGTVVFPSAKVGHSAIEDKIEQNE